MCLCIRRVIPQSPWTFSPKGVLFTAVFQIPSAFLHRGDMFNRDVCIPVPVLLEVFLLPAAGGGVHTILKYWIRQISANIRYLMDLHTEESSHLSSSLTPMFSSAQPQIHTNISSPWPPQRRSSEVCCRIDRQFMCPQRETACRSVKYLRECMCVCVCVR